MFCPEVKDDMSILFNVNAYIHYWSRVIDKTHMFLYEAHHFLIGLILMYGSFSSPLCEIIKICYFPFFFSLQWPYYIDQKKLPYI